MVDQAMVDRFWSKVNKTDDCWVWKNIRTSGSYGALVISRDPLVKKPAHRLSWEIANGPIPKGMFIDHICRNHACVRPDHLRLATPKQNLEHLARLRANNTSGYRGVCWNKKQGFWQATVVHNYERHFLGFFDTAAEAGEAARLKRLELYTHNALDRSPDAVGVTVVPRQRCGHPTLRSGPCKKFRGRCVNHDGLKHEVANRETSK